MLTTRLSSGRIAWNNTAGFDKGRTSEKTWAFSPAGPACYRRQAQSIDIDLFCHLTPLKRHQFLDASLGQFQQLVKVGTREWPAFRGALYLDKLTRIRHDDVGIDLGMGVFGIV